MSIVLCCVLQLILDIQENQVHSAHRRAEHKKFLKTAAVAAFLAAQPIHRIDVASVQKAAIARQAHSQLREHVSLMEQRAQMAEEAVQ